MPEEPDGALPPEEAGDTPARKAGGGKSNLIMMVGVALAALLGAFVIANFGLKPMLMKNKSTQTVEKKQTAGKEKAQVKPKEKSEGGKGAEAHGGGGGESSGEADNFFKIEGIVVNPAATGGSRFLSTTIGFQLEGPEGKEVFKGNEIKIRDALISILSSKTVSELADAETRELIRRQILKYVNQICQPAKAEAIYFVDFVLQ